MTTYSALILKKAVMNTKKIQDRRIELTDEISLIKFQWRFTQWTYYSKVVS